MGFSWLGPLGFIKAGNNDGNTVQHTKTVHKPYPVNVPHPEKLGYTKDIKNIKQGTNNIFSALYNLTQALRKPEKINFDLPKIKNEKDAFNYTVKREAEKSFMDQLKGSFFNFINMSWKINFMKDKMAKGQYMQLANKNGAKKQQNNSGFNLFNPFRFF